jgi:hypothetical protein
MIDICPAHFPDDLLIVQSLFRDYADSIGVDLCLERFEAELPALPGKEYSRTDHQ